MTGRARLTSRGGSDKTGAVSSKRCGGSTAAGILRAAAAIAVLASPPLPAAAESERIVSFHSEVRIHPGGDLDVRETIEVHAGHEEIRRGIYRDFPTRYRSLLGVERRVPFEVVEALRDGKPEPWHSERISNGVRVYLGEAGRLVEKGRHTYVLAYRTGRQLGFFEDHDELYWNVTGTGWSFFIEKASATVRLPEAARGAAAALEAYTGYQGQKGSDYRAAWDAAAATARFETLGTLAPRQGLTVVVSFPKGVVAPPSPSERRARLLADNRALLAGAGGMLLALAVYLAAWARVGRDPRRGVIVPQYEPPKGFTPAAVRYVRRMGFDHRTFAAAVVSMAVKRRLEIVRAGRQFVLRRVPGEDGALAPEERAAYAKLFGGKRESVELERAQHAVVGGALNALKVRLGTQLDKAYFLLNRAHLAPGALLSLASLGTMLLLQRDETAMLAAFMTIWLSGWTAGVWALTLNVGRAWRAAASGSAGSRLLAVPAAVFVTLFALPFFAGEIAGLGLLIWQGSPAYVALLIAALAMAIAFYHLLRAPTSRGRAVLDRIEGFEMFLAATEADRIARLGPERTLELYERFLPYAVALDLEERWSEQFARVLERAGEDGRAYSPSWYRGGYGPRGFSASSFASGLGGGLAGAVASSSTAPGSRSGGGGGGSSGGGGGGGGGGGW